MKLLYSVSCHRKDLKALYSDWHSVCGLPSMPTPQEKKWGFWKEWEDGLSRPDPGPNDQCGQLDRIWTHLGAGRVCAKSLDVGRLILSLGWSLPSHRLCKMEKQAKCGIHPPVPGSTRNVPRWIKHLSPVLPHYD